ncbi:MAG: CoA transferase [Chloroflexi bacterium]|nr:CoA transferase [Chloroflexota bacterium]
MLAEAPGALNRFRILDLTTALGQPASRYLADLGADVIKIEPPDGDPARLLAPFAGGEPHLEKSLFFLHFNLNKRGLVLDLGSTAGRQTFLRLVRTADAVLESYAPGYLASLGLGFESLERERPGLVLTSITPFGQTGPYREFQGNDFVCDALGGMVYIEGERGGRPVVQPHYQAIQMAGLHAAYGTLVALWHRRRTGQGQQVDVSVQEVVAHQYFNLVNYASYQEIAQRPGKLSSGRPTNFFPCSDGWVLISIVQVHQWRAFAEWTQDPLLMHPRFEDPAAREGAVETLDERMAAFTRTMTVAQCMQGAIEHHIPATPVNDIRQFVEHPHTHARGFMVEVEHPFVGRYRAAGASALYSATPWRLQRPAPTLGQHTAEVLQELEHGAPRQRPALAAPRGASSLHPGLPLEGVRVLDLTKSWAGPFGTRYLADFGAEVIRVESFKYPEGRVLSPEPDPTGWQRQNTTYAEVHRNKLSITLDLHTEEGREVLKRLVAVSDLVVENFHPATLPGWGLGYEELRRVNPRLIRVNAPGFGTTGPARDYFSYGGCVAAFTGIAHLWGHPGSEQNERSKHAYPDFVTAANLALAVMAALHHREETGEGQRIELAQIDAAANAVATAILEHTLNGTDPEPLGNRGPNAAPQGVYPCHGDDRWVAISVAANDQWEALRHVMGDPAWARDPAFATLARRQAHQEEMDQRIAAWTRDLTPHQVMYRCQAAGVPAGVVASGEDLYLDPQLRARGYVIEIEHPAPGRLEHPGMTVRLTRTPGRVRFPAPLTGQHTREVLERLLGLSPQEQHQLAERGVLA